MPDNEYLSLYEERMLELIELGWEESLWTIRPHHAQSQPAAWPAEAAQSATTIERMHPSAVDASARPLAAVDHGSIAMAALGAPRAGLEQADSRATQEQNLNPLLVLYMELQVAPLRRLYSWYPN